MADPTSSPPHPDATVDDTLHWYKSQYEQLVSELADFRESSHELEKELEKDLEAADKRERSLKEKAEALQFEADEWKEKSRKAKGEANAAQNALEKEITTLRDSNRTLQLRLRDIEVVNDDFERQARNTTSTLEDMESKYNQALERSVMMEEEIRIGEAEREKLRIEAQRLREELSDLKVEAEVLQDKLRKTENRHLSTISTDISVPESPTFEQSPRSSASSPPVRTPLSEIPLPSPQKGGRGTEEPPSPPMSDASAPPPRPTSRLRTPVMNRSIPPVDSNVTPRPRAPTVGTASRQTVLRPAGTRSTTQTPRQVSNRTPALNQAASSNKLPTSASLRHVRTLTAQMQRLETRVNNARSKLPAPVATPSPRTSIGAASNISSSVTVRSRKRTGSVAAPSQTPSGIARPHVPRLSTSGVSRLSFGPGPLPNRSQGYDPDSSTISMSRPESRASFSSSGYARAESTTSRMEYARPTSRASTNGPKPPLGFRPRSSMSNQPHSHSASISSQVDIDEEDESEVSMCASSAGRTPSRLGRFNRYTPAREGGRGGSAIPLPRRSLTSSMASSRNGELGETY